MTSLARRVAESEGAPPDSELAVLVCSDSEITSLNRAYTGKDRATNVLAFAGSDPQDLHAEGAPLQIGDVVVSLETAEREAQEAGLEPASRLERLVVHGILHLFGHDHESDADAKKMQALEDAYLAR